MVKGNVFNVRADDDTSYRDGGAVVRCDRGQVSQGHVMVSASAFIEWIEHLKARYGPPTGQNVTVRPVLGGLEIIKTVVR